MGVRFWDRSDVPEEGGVTWCDFHKICRLVISIFIFVSTMRKQTFEAQGVSPWIRVPQRLFRGSLRQADDASPGNRLSGQRETNARISRQTDSPGMWWRNRLLSLFQKKFFLKKPTFPTPDTEKSFADWHFRV